MIRGGTESPRIHHDEYKHVQRWWAVPEAETDNEWWEMMSAGLWTTFGVWCMMAMSMAAMVTMMATIAANTLRSEPDKLIQHSWI